ncbi:MAG: Spore coat domain protein [Massilia sp.]|nr:Spore coat domain protein [Massilia sp.]
MNMNMNANMSKLALAIGALAIAGGAWAADTSTKGVSATVAAECAVGSGVAIALGPLEMLDLGTATQTVNDTVAGATFPAICTNGTTLPKFAYASMNTSGAGADFRLKGVGGTVNDYITYTLDPTLDGSGMPIGALAVAHPDFLADGTTNTLALSARILAANKAAKLVQAYIDTITITASWGI